MVFAMLVMCVFRKQDEYISYFINCTNIASSDNFNAEYELFVDDTKEMQEGMIVSTIHLRHQPQIMHTEKMSD